MGIQEGHLYVYRLIKTLFEKPLNKESLEIRIQSLLTRTSRPPE